MDQCSIWSTPTMRSTVLEWTRRAPREPVPTPNADREGGLLAGCGRSSAERISWPDQPDEALQHPRKATHADGGVRRFQDIPNVGAATAGDFATLGIHSPLELGQTGSYALLRETAAADRPAPGPCVCDTFIAVVRSWWAARRYRWHFTAERKRHFAR